MIPQTYTSATSFPLQLRQCGAAPSASDWTPQTAILTIKINIVARILDSFSTGHDPFGEPAKLDDGCSEIL